MSETLQNTPLKDLRFFNLDDEGDGVGTWFATTMTDEQIENAFEECKKAMRIDDDVDAMSYITQHYDCYQFVSTCFLTF